MESNYTPETVAKEMGYTGEMDTPEMHMFIIDKVYAMNLQKDSDQMVADGMDPKKARVEAEAKAKKSRAGAIRYQKEIGNIK